MPTKSRVDKQVSQKIVGIQISGNDTAQNHPARLAVRTPKHCRATSMINHTVSMLNRSCIPITAIAAVKVNEPNMRKKRPMIAGYPGARRAVGPVDPPNGELSPCPATREWASVPSSIPREKSQLWGNCAMTNQKISNRSSSATARIANPCGRISGVVLVVKLQSNSRLLTCFV